AFWGRFSPKGTYSQDARDRQLTLEPVVPASEAAALTQNPLDLHTRKAQLVSTELIDQNSAYLTAQIVRRGGFGGHDKHGPLEGDVQEAGIFLLSAKAAIGFSVRI